MHRLGLALSPLVLVAVMACKPSSLGEANTNASDESGTATGTGTTDPGEAGSADNGCPVGSEGCPCTGGGACDPGLMCESGVCEECPIGSEGCPCTDGGSCDPGLMCDGGACVPEANPGDGDPTTGDGDPTTGDGDPTTGDGDPGGPFQCVQLSNDCSQLDQQDCVCAGCYDNGQCQGNDDCICSDCANNSGCNNCNTNGTCHPYYEGCNCPDCMNHPLCN